MIERLRHLLLDLDGTLLLDDGINRALLASIEAAAAQARIWIVTNRTETAPDRLEEFLGRAAVPSEHLESPVTRLVRVCRSLVKPVSISCSPDVERYLRSQGLALCTDLSRSCRTGVLLFKRSYPHEELAHLKRWRAEGVSLVLGHLDSASGPCTASACEGRFTNLGELGRYLEIEDPSIVRLLGKPDPGLVTELGAWRAGTGAKLVIGNDPDVDLPFARNIGAAAFLLERPRALRGWYFPSTADEAACDGRPAPGATPPIVSLDSVLEGEK